MNVKEKKNNPLFVNSKASDSNSEIYDNTWKVCSQHIHSCFQGHKSQSMNVNVLS